jgi:thiamine kinase-like enzyme
LHVSQPKRGYFLTHIVCSTVLDAIYIFFQCFRNWLGAAKSLSLPEEAKAFCLDTVEEEISILEKELSGAYQHIGFCHNDLQYGNIMIDEETNSITIIVSFSLLVI